MLSKPLFRSGDQLTVITDGETNTKYRMAHLATPFYYMNEDMMELSGHNVMIGAIVNPRSIDSIGYQLCVHHMPWVWTDAMFAEGRRLMQYITNPYRISLSGVGMP